MKKNVKRRSYKFEVFVILLFTISAMAYLMSSLFLHSYNNTLSMEIQSVKGQISTLTVENNALNVKIQTLSTKDRVMEIANDAGLELNQTNIITVYNGDN